MRAVDVAAKPQSPIPILILSDCEPDPRELPPNDRQPWVGFERYFDFMAEQRARLAAESGRDVRFNWFWRMDPQIERAYGSLDWGVATYARQVAEMQRHGDGIGLHTHAWRWDEAAQGWIVDHGNAPWVESCVRRSFAAFRAAFGRDCEIFRFGDGWFDAALIPLLEELGARIDLTLEPDMAAIAGVLPHERATGRIPDRRGIPLTPYRPSRTDFRRRDDSGRTRLWLLPASTGTLRRRPKLSKFNKLLRWWRSPARRISQLSLEIDPRHFKQTLRHALRRARPTYAAITIRTDVGTSAERLKIVAQNLDTILRHKKADRFRFATATEALKLLTGEAC